MVPVLIGVTGNAGGGKSTFIEVLEKSGCAVIKADDLAKEVIYVPKNYDVLKEIFGNQIFGKSEKPNIKLATDIFFKLDDFGQMTRNLMTQCFSDLIWSEIKQRASDMRKLFVFIEAAILFEQGLREHFNYIICVYCDEVEARKRIQVSRKWPKERIDAVTQIQMPIQQKILLSDASLDTTCIPLENMDAETKKFINTIGIKI